MIARNVAHALVKHGCPVSHWVDGHVQVTSSVHLIVPANGSGLTVVKVGRSKTKLYPTRRTYKGYAEILEDLKDAGVEIYPVH